MGSKDKHDDRERSVIYVDVCGNAGNLLNRFTTTHGVSKVGFIDALMHGLLVADAAWLENVVTQARSFDAARRNRRGR